MKVITAIHVRKKREGSVLIIALLTLAVLSVVGATVLLSVSSRYGYTEQAVGWQGALGFAEAGADFGLANCRWTANGNSTPWAGWKKYVSANQTWVPVTDAADANTELTAGRRIIYDLPSGSHLTGTGQGATDGWYHVEVDAPASLVIAGNPWYRIRATGYTGLPGPARANNDSPDGTKAQGELRKVDLRVDHFIARYGDFAHAAPTAVSVAPQATRRIEVIVQPKGPFQAAMILQSKPNSPTVDSYSSLDLVHYPGGLWNSTARNVATGVGTNGNIYINSPVANSDLSAMIYGNVATNGGTVTANPKISGTVNNSTVTTILPVTTPSWAVAASGVAPTTLTPAVNSTTYGTYSSIPSGLTVSLPNGSPAGSTASVNIYLTGDIGSGNFNGSGNGTGANITVGVGVTLKIWFAGKAGVKPPNNLNQRPQNLQFYGVNPVAGSSIFWIDGNNYSGGASYFIVDAPGHDMINNANPDLCGSWIAKSILDNGPAAGWHFDEVLKNSGIPTDYKRASWVEDER